MGSGSADYADILEQAQAEKPGQLGEVLAEELPHVWRDAYRQMTPHQTNILRFHSDGFEYLFDFPSELVAEGALGGERAVEDRLVAVHGRSRPATGKRRDSAIRGMPLGPAQTLAPSGPRGYDRGHFIAHSLGGGLDVNLFPQPSALNRGWTEEGKLFRAMERYCQRRPGTYCFSRPMYLGKSAHPAMVEFGVLKAGGGLWVHTFPNTVDSDELQVIEKLLAEKAAADRR